MVGPGPCGAALADVERAQELAPHDVLSKAIAAWCWSQRAAHGFSTTPERDRATALRLAEEAARLGQDDPLAVGLVPEASEQAILAAVEDHRAPAALQHRAMFTLRSRFSEDRLASAAARGVRQYVMLGAGLETFPWRQPEFARGMRIFFPD